MPMESNPLRETVSYLWGYIHGACGHEGKSGDCTEDVCAQARAALERDESPLPEHAARVACVVDISDPTWNRWAPNALESSLAPAQLVEAYNRWQPDHLKIGES